MSDVLGRFFTKGRHVETTSLRWFAMLSLLAGGRRWRRGTLRYQTEQERIEQWLEIIRDAPHDCALEIVKCQQLIKGYGDTFAHGMENYTRIIERYLAGRLTAAGIVRLREAALADEHGAALETALAL
ncbi:MAG: DUF6537 domain-containing protein [Afipia sp.]|nr:DUF6537 domain-containing protein [Afipia sp.]